MCVRVCVCASHSFKRVDEDGSGEVEFEEFEQVRFSTPDLGECVPSHLTFHAPSQALYVLDPINGNTLGFRPSKVLTPHDAFLLFDSDR